MSDSASFMPHGSTPLSASFTCNTCGIKFPTAELQRQHMKTEWHRYNLKRRVAQLPAISSDTFADLVLSRQSLEQNRLADEDEYGFAINNRKTKSGMRQLTKKDLKRQQKRGRPLDITGDLAERDPSLAPSVESVHSEFSEFSIGEDQHSIERKSTVYSEDETSSEYNFTDKLHTDLESSDEESEEESDISDSESYDELKEEVTATTCFYCGLKHTEREENIRHMYLKHGLYIPERSYLVDPEGLLVFLGGVIMEDHECLSCGFLGKNLESIRQHMRSKGHCKIPYETKEEKATISEFYNFNTEQSRPKAGNGKKKAVAFDEGFEIIEGAETTENGSGEEDSEDSEDYGDSNYSIVQIDPSGVELTLPTGSKIGHRSMTRYYRQNLALPRDLNESERTVTISDRRFAPGLTVKEVTKQEKLTRRIEERSKNHFYRKDKKSQINYQPHFRDEILGPM